MPSPGGAPAAILARLAIAELETAAVERRDGERLGLALLPREILAARQVETDVDDVEQFSFARFLILAPILIFTRAREVAQFVHRDVVVGVEPRERVGAAFHTRARRAHVGTNQAIAIHRMERKLVDVDEDRHDEADGEDTRSGARAVERGIVDDIQSRKGRR